MKSLFSTILFFCLITIQAQDTVRINQDLFLVPLTEHSFLHVSSLPTEDYGKVSCNGLLYQVGNEVIMADTPATLEATKALLQWLDARELSLRAVLVNHFHNDCLAGLPAVHEKGINSYSHTKTVDLAIEDQMEAPLVTFSDSLVLHIGEQQVVAAYLGPGHSPDNAVVYLPQDNLLFGGCLVKSLKASKGYLGAANVERWSETVSRVKARFNPQIVIPGHGAPGGQELLEYTIEMFKSSKK